MLGLIKNLEQDRRNPPIWFDRKAYHKKLELLEKLSDTEYFDNPLFSVLTRLYRLPLSTTGSCSWYTKEGHPDTLDDCCPAHVLISEDQHVNPEARNIQILFRSQLPSLENAINKRLGMPAVKVIAQRFVERDNNGSPKYQSVIDLHDKQQVAYDLLFLVQDNTVSQTRGREVLVTIWQEFMRYIEKFDGRNEVIPDFHNGNDFIRKRAYNYQKAA